MKSMIWIAGLISALISPLSLGIVLDCELNVDGTYTCVEISGVSVSPQEKKQATEAQRVYIEQASKECELKEPRRRTNSKGGSAGRSEDIKRAKREYKQCIASKAEALKAAADQ